MTGVPSAAKTSTEWASTMMRRWSCPLLSGDSGAVDRAGNFGEKSVTPEWVRSTTSCLAWES